MFVEEYLHDFNATRAAERAGYRGDDNTLAATGSRLLRNDKVADRISARLRQSAMSADEVLRRFAEQARADIGDFIAVDDKGDFVIDWMAIKGKTHLIKSVRRNSHGTTIELYDAQAALDKLSKVHGLYTENVRHSHLLKVADMSDEELERKHADLIGQITEPEPDE